MPSVKTAISIDEGLFERAKALALELNVSRSQVFASALEDYLRRLENRRLLAEINAALEGDSQDEEVDTVRRMWARERKSLATDW